MLLALLRALLRFNCYGRADAPCCGLWNVKKAGKRAAQGAVEDAGVLTAERLPQTVVAGVVLTPGGQRLLQRHFSKRALWLGCICPTLSMSALMTVPIMA